MRACVLCWPIPGCQLITSNWAPLVDLSQKGNSRHPPQQQTLFPLVPIYIYKNI